MTRLADYFIVVGYDHEKERSGSGGSIGKILQRFPEKDWDSCPFIEGIELFCQPTGWTLSKTHQQPTFFVSVLTDIDGERHYAAAFTFHEPVSMATRTDDSLLEETDVVHRSTMLAPKSLVIVSRLDCFDTFRKCLGIIYTIYVDSIAVPIETVVGNILGCIHVPPSGGPQIRFSVGAGDRQSIQPPLSSTIPCTGTSVALLFSQLGIHTCLYLFCAALTDHKLLFHSFSYTRLTQACQAVIHLLYPLKYSYVYIPILPVSLLEVLNTPTPFIAGVHSCLKDEVNDLLDVIIVDLDSGSIKVPECVQVPLLPEPLLTKTKSSLSMILNPDLAHTDLAYPPTPKKPSSSIHRDKEIRAVFIRLFGELFQGYRSSLHIIRIHPKPFITFHKANFLGCVGMADDEFLMRVLDGMCFSAFVADRGPPYRVCDIFDEVYASMPEFIRDETTEPESILRHIRDTAAQLYIHENPNPQSYVQKVLIPTEGAYSRIHQPPLPLLNAKIVQDMIDEGVSENKNKTNNNKPHQLRKVPMGSYGQSTPRLHQAGDNSRRLDVLRNCIDFVFENKISDARKVFPAVLRALKSRVARKALCDELEYHIKLNNCQLEHQQFDLIVRLLNSALQNDSSMDEYGTAAAILPLATTFYRRLCTGVIQFVYTCIQEHAVWGNLQFWYATFYQDVQKEIRHLYVDRYEEHSVKEQITPIQRTIEKDGSLGRVHSHAGDAQRRNIPPKPREITALEIAAEQLRVWSSVPEDKQQEMINNEESTVYSQAIHYANRMVYMRVPLDAQKSLKNTFGVEPENNSSITPSIAESDSIDAESGFDEMDVTEVGSGVVKFISRFVDKVCNDSWVTSEHLKSLHQMIPGVVAMHIETLDAVYTESKRLPPIQKPKILTPVLLSGEEIIMDGLRAYLLTDGREEGLGGLLGGPTLLPAEGAVFLTTYRVIFKGTPCDPLACEHIVIRSFPISSLTKEKRISVQYMPHLDQWLSEGLQIRSNILQLMKVTFDEEVGSENVEMLRKLINKVRSPMSVFETFAFTGSVIMQTTQLVKQKDKNASLKQFAKRTLIKTARKAGIKPSNKSRKQKYLVPTPPMKRRTIRSNSECSDRPSSESFDDSLSIIDEADYTRNLATDPKSLENLFKIPGYADYRRLGLGSLPQTRNRHEPFRICVANANFSVTTSYPALVVVPQTINDDSIRKLAQCHRQYRFPAVVWRHPRTKGLLIRASGFHSRGLMGMLKPQNTTGQSSSELHAHTEQDKFFRAIVAMTPMPTSQPPQYSHTNSLSSVDSLMMAANISEGVSIPGTPESTKRSANNSKLSSLKSTVSHKASKSDDDQSSEATTPATQRRNMIRRAVESIKPSRTSQFMSSSELALNTLGRIGSRKENRLSNSSLDWQATRGSQAQQNGGPDRKDHIHTATQSFRHVALYVLGEKTHMKGIKVDTHSKCEFIHIDFHDVRHVKASFKKLMRACAPSATPSNTDYSFYKSLDESEWLQQVQNILQVAGATVDLLDVQGSSVMVCLEDGWDFTCQLTSTAQLLLDPFYRTLEGFRVLVEREWLSFGHRFTHRSNQTMANLTSGFAPMFLQWLDVVHQILSQFPLSFEFNQTFIKFLAFHSVSNRFRTFMLDSEVERMEAGWLQTDKTSAKNSPSDEDIHMSPKSQVTPEGTSIWDYVFKYHRKNPIFVNFHFCPHLQETVLRPYSNISNLRIWDYFLCEDLAHGPLYDFEIVNKEIQQAEEDDLDGVERRKTINSCYDNVSLRQPHVFAQMFKEIQKVKNDLGQLPDRWQKIWNTLEIETETLKRRPSITTQAMRTHGRSIHKRSTLEILVRGKLHGETSRTFNQPHRFDKFTYTTPNYCDHCSQILWGLGKTGLHCSECGYNCHDKCALSVPKNCTRVSSNLEPHPSLTSLVKPGGSEPGGTTTNPALRGFGEYSSSRKNEHHVQEGYLFKRGALLKGWKQRWFVLDSLKNQLRYYDAPDDPSCKGYIDLAEVISVQAIKNVQGAPKKSDENAFFEMKTIRRVYHYLASDSKLASDWIEKIHKYIQ